VGTLVLYICETACVLIQVEFVRHNLKEETQMKVSQILLIVLASSLAIAQQPCPSGFHHEGDSAACWPDVSRHEESQKASAPLLAEQSKSLQQTPQQLIPQPKQPASLVIFRQAHFTGSALKPSVYVDGREVVRLKNGNYFTMQIEPGKHEITSSAKNEPPLSLDVKDGANYIQMIVVTGTWRGAGRLIPVSPEDAKVEVQKLHVQD
jgi:hypothetical protein